MQKRCLGRINAARGFDVVRLDQMDTLTSRGEWFSDTGPPGLVPEGQDRFGDCFGSKTCSVWRVWSNMSGQTSEIGAQKSRIGVSDTAFFAVFDNDPLGFCR